MKYQVMPELTPVEFEALKADIRENGVLDPVDVDENGDLLDGHHRVRAWTELRTEGVELADYPRIIRAGLTEEQKRNHARRLNVHRRHLTKEQRGEVMKAMRADGATYQEIAKAMGVTTKTAQNVAKNELCKNTKLLGADGKSRPATYKPRKKAQPAPTLFASSAAQETKTLEVLTDTKSKAPDLYPKLVAGEISVSTAALAMKTREVQAEQAKALAQDPGYTAPIIHLADALEFMAKIANDSVDLLLTDPPYSTDVADIESFVAAWVPVALAKLKPTGRAYICIGAYPIELAAYLNVLNGQCKFIVDAPLIWTYRNTLGVTPKMKYNLNYQVVLHLYSADSRPLDTSITNEMFSVQDINAPDGRQGDRHHAWQKPDELARRLVRHATSPGDLILDPFACTGTFPLMAAQMGRSVMACDIDPVNLKIAQERGCHVELG